MLTMSAIIKSFEKIYVKEVPNIKICKKNYTHIIFHFWLFYLVLITHTHTEQKSISLNRSLFLLQMKPFFLVDQLKKKRKIHGQMSGGACNFISFKSNLRDKQKQKQT